MEGEAMVRARSALRVLHQRMRRRGSPQKKQKQQSKQRQRLQQQQRNNKENRRPFSAIVVGRAGERGDSDGGSDDDDDHVHGHAEVVEEMQAAEEQPQQEQKAKDQPPEKWKDSKQPQQTQKEEEQEEQPQQTQQEEEQEEQSQQTQQEEQQEEQPQQAKQEEPQEEQPQQTQQDQQRLSALTPNTTSTATPNSTATTTPSVTTDHARGNVALLRAFKMWAEKEAQRDAIKQRVGELLAQTKRSSEVGEINKLLAQIDQLKQRYIALADESRRMRLEMQRTVDDELDNVGDLLAISPSFDHDHDDHHHDSSSHDPARTPISIHQSTSQLAWRFEDDDDVLFGSPAKSRRSSSASTLSSGSSTSAASVSSTKAILHFVQEDDKRRAADPASTLLSPFASPQKTTAASPNKNNNSNNSSRINSNSNAKPSPTMRRASRIPVPKRPVRTEQHAVPASVPELTIEEERKLIRDLRIHIHMKEQMLRRSGDASEPSGAGALAATTRPQTAGPRLVRDKHQLEKDEAMRADLEESKRRLDIAVRHHQRRVREEDFQSLQQMHSEQQHHHHQQQQQQQHQQPRFFSPVRRRRKSTSPVRRPQSAGRPSRFRNGPMFLTADTVRQDLALKYHNHATEQNIKELCAHYSSSHLAVRIEDFVRLIVAQHQQQQKQHKH